MAHHQPGGLGIAKFCEGLTTKTGNFTFNTHPSLWGDVEQIEGVLTLLSIKSKSTSASSGSALACPGDIACNQVPDHTHPQGVL